MRPHPAAHSRWPLKKIEHLQKSPTSFQHRTFPSRGEIKPPTPVLQLIYFQPQRKLNPFINGRKFFFLFIGREPTTWPANNCRQIMVCSCAMSSNSVWLKVWLQIIFCTCVKETVVSSFLRSLLRDFGRSLRFPRIFIQKTNSVIEW